MTDANTVSNRGRIAWLERDGDDFPYYDGKPVDLSGLQWISILIGVAVGYAALTTGFGVIHGAMLLKGFTTTILYVAIPLTVLAIVSKGHWTALFRKIRGGDVLMMIGFAILNIIVTLVCATLFINLDEATANPAVAGLSQQSTADIFIFYIRTLIQLFGEEVMTILPFLALLWFFTTRMKTGRVTAVLLAWVVTAVLFAAEHLSTYGWNFLQALTGVGVARLVLTLPYIITKNIWVGTGAHILNDWIMFTVSLLGAGAGEAAG